MSHATRRRNALLPFLLLPLIVSFGGTPALARAPRVVAAPVAVEGLLAGGLNPAALATTVNPSLIAPLLFSFLSPQCQNSYSAEASQFAGKTSSNGANMRGIRADINPSNYSLFGPCAFEDYGDDGASLWVALVPGGNNTGGDPYEAILQVGMILCNDADAFSPNSACRAGDDFDTYNVAPNYGREFFWAKGGCDHPPAALIVDEDWQGNPLGFDVGLGSHSYKIDRKENDVHQNDAHYDLSIDGVVIKDIDADADAIECWIKDSAGNKDVSIQGETWDKGDHLGYDGSSASTFDDVDVRWPSAGSFADWAISSCVLLRISGWKHVPDCGVVDHGGGESTISVWTTHLP